MQLDELERTIRLLATLDPGKDPFISCYVGLETEADWRDALDRRIRVVRRGLPRADRRPFEEALGMVEHQLADAAAPGVRGTAVFARGGDDPLLVPLRFEVPLPTHFGVGAAPSIYHLVELKDTYHRYVVVLTNEREARILEINLGSVTEEIWRERPAEPERVRERWSREHYRHRRAEQTEEFVREKVAIVDRLMARGGHTHLMVAGDERMVRRVCDALPRHLQTKLVDAVVTAADASPQEAVLATIQAFVRAEEQESQAVVDVLARELAVDGLAAAGAEATLQALRWGQADTVVVAKDWIPAPAWACHECAAVVIGPPRPVCTECGARGPVAADLREEIARLAEQASCHVEVVNESETLRQLGGVGCLLRYRVL